MKSDEQAPPVIDSSLVRAFAVVRPDVAFTGKQFVVVGGVKVGAATRLVVAFNERTKDYLLLLCDDHWQSFACAGFPTIEEALETAERWYNGISAHWVRTSYTAEEDRRHMEEYFHGEICSFCGALPNQRQSMFEGRDSWICDACVIEFWGWLRERKGGDSITNG